jgi:hypothetical protein
MVFINNCVLTSSKLFEGQQEISMSHNKSLFYTTKQLATVKITVCILGITLKNPDEEAGNDEKREIL